MACCNKFSRWLIAIVSICVIVCCVVAAVVVYKKEKGKDWSKLIKNNIPFIFILVAMSVAVVSSIIGFVFCCSDSQCLQITYLIIIIFVIVVEVAAIVLAFVFKNKIIDGIEENWTNNKYNETRVFIEREYQCCGFKTQNSTIQCGYNPENGTAPLCFNKISDEINDNMKNLQIAVIIMAIVEIILLVCASYLVCCDKERVSNM